MSASVPTSPSALKSAVLVHGSEGQLPLRHAKKDSMSASVPTSPSQLKSAVPQVGPVWQGLGVVAELRGCTSRLSSKSLKFSLESWQPLSLRSSEVEAPARSMVKPAPSKHEA